MTIYQFVLFLYYLGIVYGNTSCPDVWIADRGSCYLFVPERSLSFFESQHYCTQHNAHLVVVNDAEESKFLKSYMIDKLIQRNWWIGLTDELVEGSWVWYPTGRSPEYTDWDSGEPNPHQVNAEDCAAMYRDGITHTEFKWVDISCVNQNSPVCEM